MTLQTFTSTDFEVFTVDGLEERMSAIKTNIHPKLDALGGQFAEYLSQQTDENFFYHVAKHARRKVNPPNDTWVAFSTNKRGYKMLPHFQIGLWGTHAFIYFGLIYECPQKVETAHAFLEHLNDLKTNIPNDFVWSIDHTKPGVKLHKTLETEDLQKMIERLATVKKAELLVGIHISPEEFSAMTNEQFLAKIESTMQSLLPLYAISNR
ncbi:MULTISPECIES: YktB family protein [unclassified Bacillus (in: firmicutes)]|uniref:YktB family protein n=1 Tax=unclassified Bacillus (in: firmicutes) TaxID=185979 RepID=UPI0036531E7B